MESYKEYLDTATLEFKAVKEEMHKIFEDSKGTLSNVGEIYDLLLSCEIRWQFIEKYTKMIPIAINKSNGKIVDACFDCAVQLNNQVVYLIRLPEKLVHDLQM